MNSWTAIARLISFVTLICCPPQSYAGSQSSSEMLAETTDNSADESPIVAPVKRVAPQMPVNKVTPKAAGEKSKSSASPSKAAARKTKP